LSRLVCNTNKKTAHKKAVFLLLVRFAAFPAGCVAKATQVLPGDEIIRFQSAEVKSTYGLTLQKEGVI
jgi:hypothetical protein